MYCAQLSSLAFLPALFSFHQKMAMRRRTATDGREGEEKTIKVKLEEISFRACFRLMEFSAVYSLVLLVFHFTNQMGKKQEILPKQIVNVRQLCHGSEESFRHSGSPSDSTFDRFRIYTERFSFVKAKGILYENSPRSLT